MSADVLVIGAGLIGCAVAREAARAGLRTVVLERGAPGAEASSAAAGMLSPLAEARAPGPFTDALLRAREMYPAFAAALREETGLDAGYSDAGTLYLSLREADDAELEHRWGWQSAAGLRVERLTTREARELEPGIAPAVRWALRFPGDHQVDNRVLSRMAWMAAAAAGATFRTGCDAAALTHGGGRATGVRLTTGEHLRAGVVVLAGGSWSATLGGLPRPLPVEPVQGQLLALESVPPLFRHVVDSPRCYLVPRADGRVLAGATVERVGFRKSVTPRGLGYLIDGAVEIAPSLADAPLVECWSGLRPGTPDGMPIIGPDPEVGGLLYATGHFRNGILLAPLTAALIAGLLRGEAVSGLDLFDARRFG